MLNVLCILTNIYNKNKANNIFHRVLYQILCSSPWEEGIIDEVRSLKLWVGLMLDFSQSDGEYRQILVLGHA